MAVTKIWAIKDSIKRVVDYAKNSEKTEYDPVKQVLHYAEDGRKVVAEKNHICYRHQLQERDSHRGNEGGAGSI